MPAGVDGRPTSLAVEVVRYVEAVIPQGGEVRSFTRSTRPVKAVRTCGDEVQVRSSTQSNSARAVAQIVAGLLEPGLLNTVAIVGDNQPSCVETSCGSGFSVVLERVGDNVANCIGVDATWSGLVVVLEQVGVGDNAADA